MSVTGLHGENVLALSDLLVTVSKHVTDMGGILYMKTELNVNKSCCYNI
jgi:hypothetical protein